MTIFTVFGPTVSGLPDGLTVAELGPAALAIFGVAAFLFVFLFFVAIWASRYRKVGPDEVLIVSGRRYVFRDADGKTHEAGWKMIRGGGVFVFPIYEVAHALSLKPIDLDLDFERIPIADGDRARISAKAQARIGQDDLSVGRAAQSLLGKTPEQTQKVVSEVLESKLRKVLASWTRTDLLRRQSQLGAAWQEAAEATLVELGMQIVSLSVTELELEKT